MRRRSFTPWMPWRRLGPPAVPRLIDALKHEKVRAQVAYILGQIGPDAAPATTGPGETGCRQGRPRRPRGDPGAGQHRARGQGRGARA